MEIVRRRIGAEGRRISYLTPETPPAHQTILLIHGSGVSARSWTNQLQGLGHALRVFAIDLPGHGESDPIIEPTIEMYADAAHGLLDALGTGPAFVAGHSLGGAVAQALAARHPEAVKGLVLLSACAKFPETEGSPGRVFYWYLPGPIRKLVFFALAKKILFAPGSPRKAILLGMQEIRDCRPETILNDVAAAEAMDLEGVARGLRVPTLILCGSRDKLTPPALSEGLNALISGSRLHILEGAGHMLPLEVPERVNQELVDFVASVTRSEMCPLVHARGVTRRSMLRGLIDKAKGLLRRQ